MARNNLVSMLISILLSSLLSSICCWALPVDTKPQPQVAPVVTNASDVVILPSELARNHPPAPSTPANSYSTTTTTPAPSYTPPPPPPPSYAPPTTPAPVYTPPPPSYAPPTTPAPVYTPPPPSYAPPTTPAPVYTPPPPPPQPVYAPPVQVYALPPPPVYAPRPVYAPPPPVYYVPRPVYAPPPPPVYAPPPPAPVYAPPAPLYAPPTTPAPVYAPPTPVYTPPPPQPAYQGQVGRQQGQEISVDGSQFDVNQLFGNGANPAVAGALSPALGSTNGLAPVLESILTTLGISSPQAADLVNSGLPLFQTLVGTPLAPGTSPSSGIPALLGSLASSPNTTPLVQAGLPLLQTLISSPTALSALGLSPELSGALAAAAPLLPALLGSASGGTPAAGVADNSIVDQAAGLIPGVAAGGSPTPDGLASLLTSALSGLGIGDASNLVASGLPLLQTILGNPAVGNPASGIPSLLGSLASSPGTASLVSAGLPLLQTLIGSPTALSALGFGPEIATALSAALPLLPGLLGAARQGGAGAAAPPGAQFFQYGSQAELNQILNAIGNAGVDVVSIPPIGSSPNFNLANLIPGLQ